MIVKLFDRTEIVVTQDEAAKALSAMTRDVESIILRGIVINRPKKAIALILPGGYTEADRIGKEKRLAARTDHRGEYSPAKERIRKMLKDKRPQ